MLHSYECEASVFQHASAPRAPVCVCVCVCVQPGNIRLCCCRPLPTAAAAAVAANRLSLWISVSVFDSQSPPTDVCASREILKIKRMNEYETLSQTQKTAREKCEWKSWKVFKQINAKSTQHKCKKLKRITSSAYKNFDIQIFFQFCVTTTQKFNTTNKRQQQQQHQQKLIWSPLSFFYFSADSKKQRVSSPSSAWNKCWKAAKKKKNK